MSDNYSEVSDDDDNYGEVSDDEALSEFVVTLSTIRIGTLTGPRDAWRFEPVPEGALAVIRPLRSGSGTLLGAITRGNNGLLYQLEVGDKTYRPTDRLLYLAAPGRFLLWWTRDEDCYADMLENSALLEEQGSVIEVRQYHPSSRAPLRKELLGFELRSDIVHTACEHILQRHVFYESRSSPIFDVTPPAIRALFTVELMQWYTFKAHEASANNMATFEHAAAMMHAAEKGLKDAALERRAAELFPTPEERRVFDYFRDYAWRCAATGIGRGRFARSIAMHEGPSDLPQGGLPEPEGDGLGAGVQEPEGDWLDAAKYIRRHSANLKHGPAVHPYFQGVQGPLKALLQEGVTLSPDQQKLLRNYHESYLFGAKLRDTQMDGEDGFQGPTHYRGRMAARMEDRDRQLEDVRAHARALLEQHASPQAFLVSHSGAFPEAEDLIERYLDAAAYCGLRWWENLGRDERAGAPAKGSDGAFLAKEWPFWKTFKARTKLLADGGKSSGKFSKLLRERLAAYGPTIGRVEQMLDTLGRLEISLASGDVDATRHVIRSEDVSVTVDPTGEAGQVRIALPEGRKPGVPSSVTLRFLSETATQHPHGVADPPSGVGALKSYRPSTQAGPYRVQIPAHHEYLREVARHSEAFSVLGESVNVAIAAVTLCDKAKAQDKAIATFELTKGIVGILEGLPAGLAALSEELDSSALLKRAKEGSKNLKGLSTWLGHLDRVNKVYKGLGILFSDEAEVSYELRQGRPFRAETQRFSDLANIVVGAGNAIEIAGALAQAAGAAEILGCSTALLAGFSTTPWGLVIVVGGGILAAGSALVFDLTQPWDERLMKVERALDRACQNEIRGTRLLVSTRLAGLLNAVDRGWQGELRGEPA